jgi:dynein heavy chain
MSNFLHTQWIDIIVKEIRLQLANVGKGWYDLNVKTWYLFKVSKLYRMFALIKQQMEDAVIELLKSSLQAYVNHLCRPCECLIDISDDDFKWNDDLTCSPYWSENISPIFNIHLDIVDDKPTYLIPNICNGKIVEDIIEIYVNRILTTHQIPQIDPYLITRLKFDKESLKLSSIGLLNEDIQNQIVYLRRCYEKCLIPLNEYAQQYDKFIDLKRLNVNTYVEVIRMKFTSSAVAPGIEKEILRLTKLCDDIKVSVPEHIVIGPFRINVDILKASLINKRVEMMKALKHLLLTIASEKVQFIQQRYDAIMDRLIEKPLTINHLDDIAKFIPTIRNTVTELSNDMKRVLIDFRIIESLIIQLPDELFFAKWRAQLMPKQINAQIIATLKQHEIDIDHFERVHAIDVLNFLNRLVALQNDIYTYTHKYEYNDVSKISSEIDKLWNDLHVCRNHGEMLNKRCVIFNQPEIDIEPCNVHIENLFQHHKLWTMTSNFLTSKELWTEQMPLTTLDIQFIEAEIKRYEDIVDECKTYFTIVDAEMLNIIEKCYEEIRFMREMFDVVKDLRNEDMKEVHWNKLREMLCGDANAEDEDGGVVIEISPEITTFNDLVLNGIMKFAEIIKNISSEATDEATCERNEKIRLENERKTKQQREDELRKQKQLRFLARADIFN